MNDQEYKALIGDLVIQIMQLNNEINRLKKELDECKKPTKKQ